MPKVIFNTKELQSALKTVTTFTELSIQKRYTLSIDISNSLIYHHSEVATLYAKPNMQILENDGDPIITIDAHMLTKLKLPANETLLEWSGSIKGLKIKSGRFMTTLNVLIDTSPIANKQYEPEFSVKFPLKTIKAASRYAELPYSFYKNKVEMTPIHFKELNGKMVIQGEDGYSLFRVKTNVDAPEGMSFKIPRIALKTIFKDSIADDETIANLASYSLAVVLDDGQNTLFTSQLTDELKDFESIFQGLNKQWQVYVKANPKELLGGIKPLYTMIPTKDTNTCYIQATFKKPDNLNLILRHPQMGDTRFDNIPLLSEINVVGESHKYYLNMHPQAFSEFTSLLSGMPEIEWFGNDKAAYYLGIDEENGLTVEYLFPVVNV